MPPIIFNEIFHVKKLSNQIAITTYKSWYGCKQAIKFWKFPFITCKTSLQTEDGQDENKFCSCIKIMRKIG